MINDLNMGTKVYFSSNIILLRSIIVFFLIEIGTVACFIKLYFNPIIVLSHLETVFQYGDDVSDFNPITVLLHPQRITVDLPFESFQSYYSLITSTLPHKRLNQILISILL